MQTAVEWLIENLGEYFPHEIGGINYLVEQAKIMEAEQQKKIVDDAITNYELGWADKKASSQTEISVDEIDKAAWEYYTDENRHKGSERLAFRLACTWYIEQLKKK